MKNFLRKLATPILKPFENAEGDYNYRPSHRKILWIMGVLFMGIASVGLYFTLQIDKWAGLLPVTLFAAIGMLCLIVAGLGSDKAVAKIWNNRN